MLNHEELCGIEKTITEIPIGMSRGHSEKFLLKQCKIRLSRDNLIKQKGP